MRYRRIFNKGAIWFFTVVTHDRRPFLTSPANVSLLRSSFKKVMIRHPFSIEAAVVMPDHIHVIWKLPTEDNDYATRWRLIKSHFSRNCGQDCKAERDPSRMSRKQQAVWQHRFWEHCIRDQNDYARHIEYIHYNPVKHGYVTAPVDWPHSSFRRFVEQGIYSENWGRLEIHFDDGIGKE